MASRQEDLSLLSKMQLLYAMEEYRENAFSARELRRQINEIERSKLTGRARRCGNFDLLCSFSEQSTNLNAPLLEMRGKPYGNRLRIKDPNGIETRFVAANLVEFTRKEKRQIAKFIKRCREMSSSKQAYFKFKA